MKKSLPLVLLSVLLLVSATAYGLPRDAEAVLNRCGKPLKGDDTVLDNSGGNRQLKYERGTLLFSRYGNDGWSFVSGSHKKQKDLNADEMAKFMPCLKDALADSAAPAPLKPITPVQRIEVSAKRSYKKVILYTLLGLVLLGIAMFAWSRRERDEDDVDQD